MATLNAIAIKPKEPATRTQIEDTLAALQSFVEGYIEISYPFDDEVIVIGNDEAKLIGMEGTRRINDHIYAGPLLLVGDDLQGGLRSLTEEETAKYLERFKEPEEISEEETQADVGFYVWSF